MTTEKIDGVSVNTQANVYFDGKCVSHGLTLADGTSDEDIDAMCRKLLANMVIENYRVEKVA